MLAEQGEMNRGRSSGVGRRAVASSDLSAFPVATHPLKRVLDVSIAGFALLLFLPLFLVVMAVIRLESPGQSIFRQRRTGYRGQVFTIYKFRTMTVAEDSGEIRHATKNDARV